MKASAQKYMFGLLRRQHLEPVDNVLYQMVVDFDGYDIYDSNFPSLVMADVHKAVGSILGCTKVKADGGQYEPTDLDSIVRIAEINGFNVTPGINSLASRSFVSSCAQSLFNEGYRQGLRMVVRQFGNGSGSWDYRRSEPREVRFLDGTNLPPVKTFQFPAPNSHFVYNFDVALRKKDVLRNLGNLAAPKAEDARCDVYLQLK